MKENKKEIITMILLSIALLISIGFNILSVTKKNNSDNTNLENDNNVVELSDWMNYILESKITSIVLNDGSKCIENYGKEGDEYDWNCNREIKLTRNELKEIFTKLNTKQLFQDVICGKSTDTYYLNIKYLDENNNEYYLDIGDYINAKNDDKLNSLINKVDYIKLDEELNESCYLFTFENINDPETFNIMENIFNKYLK